MRLLDEKEPGRRNGYLETIRIGTEGVGRFRGGVYYGSGDRKADIDRLIREIEAADAIVIGAGAGLSTAAGFTYSGERFARYFFDFAEKYGIKDMYSGGFYPYPDAVYACLNYNEAFAPVQLTDQAICIDGDTAEVLKEILRKS